MATAFVFPGQGSQRIGMASALCGGSEVAAAVMQEVENAASFDLWRVIENGSEAELARTEHAQLAIFAVGMACVGILEQEFGYDLASRCKYLAGHSLGEYTALCAAGVFSVTDCARIIKARGELMARAAPNCEDFSMVALIGASAADVEPIIRDFQAGHEICVIANDNSPEQVVISGHREAVDAASSRLKERLIIKRAIELSTTGPFHSPIMAPAAAEFAAHIQQVRLGAPKIQVIMNESAKPVRDVQQMRESIQGQMTSRVRWRETVEFLLRDQEIDEIVEIAPGRVLSRMIKRSYPEARTCSLETYADIEEFATRSLAA